SEGTPPSGVADVRHRRPLRLSRRRGGHRHRDQAGGGQNPDEREADRNRFPRRPGPARGAPLMTTTAPSRRTFLQRARGVGAAALVDRTRPGGWLSAFQANSADAMRARMGGQPIVTTKLTDAVALMTGPGGNVIVFHGPRGTILVDGFVKPAWPKLKTALQAMGAWPAKSIVHTHWHFDHAANNRNLHNQGTAI